MEDKQIVSLYWARDPQAIDRSQEKYGPYCLSIARNILRQEQDAEESVNDTWLGAWNAMPPTHPQCLKAFFGALTRRISVDRLRRRLAGKRGGGEALIALEELAECIPSDWSMEKSVENRELIRAFNAFLSSLPPRERNLFVARYWYGLPVDELAAKFGLNKNTALSKLRRTRLRLLEYLEKEGLK